jgi:fructose-bisphosphate aldolase class I
VATTDTLSETARALVAPGRGILAIDETAPTCGKRFAEAGIESNEESRRAYREMLVTTPGLGQYISGAILFDETIQQRVEGGRTFAESLHASGIVPGIKVDKGTKPIPASPNETITDGLEGLTERLEHYREMGARFTKWRAVFRIGHSLPGRQAIEANAKAFGRYATLVQGAGLVPIVEPEVLMEGDHDIARCQEATEAALERVFEELRTSGCKLEGMILKPNMVISGTAARVRDDPSEVAARTVDTLRRCVPPEVPGIAFLSGGQTGPEACAHLNAMAALGPFPWGLSFSFGRALQYPALEIWAGKAENVPAAQAAFLHRARMSSLARSGTYTTEAEPQKA